MTPADSFRGSKVLILDFGSQYTQVIARRVRECQVYSQVVRFDTPAAELAREEARGIILSGGPASVYAARAPQPDPAIFGLGLPILGICYGLQLMGYHLGGQVVGGERREFGAGRLEVTDPESPLLQGLPPHLEVWNSHGDRLAALPAGFRSVARTENSEHAVIEDRVRHLYGLQFHPEVVHTPRGQAVIENFLYAVCGCRPDWTMGSFVDQACRQIRAQVGDEKVILGLSGGVDSSVAAVLLHRAIGDQLTCIFVNNGLLRAHEAETVQRLFGEHFHVPLKYVDASEPFLRRLRGVTDPERKRKIIGAEFIRVFEQATRELRAAATLETFLPEGSGPANGDAPASALVSARPEPASAAADGAVTAANAAAPVLAAAGSRPAGKARKPPRARYRFLAQGTLYPDVIESVSISGNPAALIKSHHNVGGLPEKMRFSLIEPLRQLFKDEVRKVGLELGLPKEIVQRQPFPGPGLAVRIAGEVTPERLRIVREADTIVVGEMKASDWYYRVWQSFAVLLPVRSVGVMGDERTYESTVVIRVVESQDGMTADWVRLPYELLGRIANRITNEVKGVNRVCYDVSSKPPSTIEWE